MVARRSPTSAAEVARWRLHTQHLAGSGATDPAAVVGGMLAVQAENPAQAGWAVAARCRLAGETAMAQALDGDVLRTHVLRPTWHFVLPDDIGWLVDLTRPRVSPILERQLLTAAVGPSILERSLAVVTDALAERHLTRAELGERLAAEGLARNGFELMVLTAWMELQGQLCSGVPRAGEHTYALLKERAPNTRRLEPETARAEVTLRYFTGHGPATERDLAYWATMTLKDVRAGLAEVSHQLRWFDLDGSRYWYGQDQPPGNGIVPRGQLLQILDEYYRGYQDSRYLLDLAGLKQRGRETSTGMTIIDSQIVGDLTRELTPDSVRFRIRLLRPLAADETNAVHEAAGRYGHYLSRAPVVRFE